MFSFVFDKLPKRKQNWEIIINGHHIPCSKENAILISKKINNFNANQKTGLEKEKKNIFFEIDIPQFNDLLICSENDYQYFIDIFNSVPVQISAANKEALKIFADELEIDELLNIINMFDQTYDLITNDETLKIQREITSKMIDLTQDNFDQILEYILNLYNDDDPQKKLIFDYDFISNAILTASLIKAEKIELLIQFLKELDSKTKNGLFQYFKRFICYELIDKVFSNEIRFIVHYLYLIDELSENYVRNFCVGKKATGFYNIDEMLDIVFNKMRCQKRLEDVRWINRSYSLAFIYNDNDNSPDSYSEEELDEYIKTGFSPNKIYQAIKNDDIELFTQLINQKSSDRKFNDCIALLAYERNSLIFKKRASYISLCAFYGAEKIFNFIILNVNPKKVINIYITRNAFAGGNIAIIHKCVEHCKMDNFAVITCLYETIKNHYIELFEWLIETYNPFSKGFDLILNGNHGIVHFTDSSFLDISLKYFNFDAIHYLLSIGICYSSLFSLSMVYNNFYLADFSLKLQYNCNDTCKYMKKNNFSPFLFEYRNEVSFFIFFFLT